MLENLRKRTGRSSEDEVTGDAARGAEAVDARLSRGSWRRRVVALAMAFATLGAVLFGSTEGQARLSRLFGQLTTVEAPCDTFCTQGTLTGGLAGTLHWRMDEMQETEIPNVSYAVGVNTITTERGTLEGTDYLLWNLETGEFIDFTVISHGTGDYAGVTGTLTIVGVFDPVAAQGSSNYVALLH